MLVILLMISVVLLVFQYKPVQTWAAKKAAAYLSGKLKTEVGISGLYIKPFSSVELDGLYVLDLQKDTLINAQNLTVELNDFSLFSSIKKKTLDFKLIQLDNVSFFLKKQKDSTANLKFIIDYFSSPDTSKTPSQPWKTIFEKTVINNLHFRYKNLLHNKFMSHEVNFNDIDVRNFSAVLRNVDIKNHLFKANMSDLTLREKSGFYIKNFNANATVDTNQILVQNMFIQTDHSLLKDYFRMRFHDFDDIDEIETKVNMDADFKSSRISSEDIGFFTSSLDKIKFDLGIDGRVSGFVNNLRAKGLTITGGQATYIKGDFSFRGLPDWDNTFLELNFDQIATNKKDLDFLYSRFTGVPNRQVPNLVAKFGNVNFKGRFTGLQNDFVAYGTFKTKLGRFDPDINLKFDKAGVPSYSGKLRTYDFDLGTLIDQGDLGRTSLTANVKGSGDGLNNLATKFDSRITYVDFKDYHYSNLVLSGKIAHKYFDGTVNINDPNVKLNLSGSIDLNPKLPVYEVVGDITNARLNQLKLLKDTITLSARINSTFSGNNLNNLDGNIMVKPIRIIDPRNNYLIDSIVIAASGSGSNHQIQLQSSLADGSLKGNYDLASLPSYFKAIAKKYVPSLKTTIFEFKPQTFDFNLTLKDLDPIMALISPDLKIPEQGTFIGHFNSAEKTADFNGFVKTIQYGKIIFHDLIIDESTTDTSLGLNVSLSKVDLTKTLFIKNINISNLLKKDSLNFNVKLSDKDATNQLDLYGLVEFGRDTSAKLKLLPSEVFLEHEKWAIANQVRIRLLDGKTEISGFQLTNGQQKVKIDGFISDNPEDKLKLVFQKFSMGTLNQLSKPSGIKLAGSLNGDAVFTSLSTSPGIDTHLTIDSMKMNETLIGNVKIASTLDNPNKEANIKLNILNRGLETMNIGGVYKLGKDVNEPLDFTIKMNQAEAIILDPFVKDLVSNLKGNLSTDLKLTGTPSDPKINGSVTLENTGVTVNYLKTAYTVNEKLTVENSKIKIDKMVMKDIKGNEAVANGTVDLTDINNPDIEVDVDAKKFMALNTTFKDNRQYYGVAYGTGRFSFNGPVDNMAINIKARTEDGTIFNIPLNTSSTAGEYDFINFVSHSDTAKRTAPVRAFKGVTLNFDLSADEKTLVKIATDYGVLEGRGQATNLSLKINSLGDFDIYGDFLISSGKFEFTAKDFISKNFQVNQGGTIRWTGNPSNAEINLKAIYEVRTNVEPLYNAAGLSNVQGSQQKLVQAELIITKSLLQPSIDFDFNFPTDPSIKDDLGTYLTDYNNRSQQALSLIIRRQFSYAAGSNLTNQVTQTAEQAVSEFAFNKLNTFISQSNIIKNLDVNIRSTSDASASLHLANDRLLLSGSLYNSNGDNNLFSGNTSQTNFFNSGFSSLTKDFEADYLINKNGNLRARYAYRVLNSTTLNTLNDQLGVQYVNGIGLVYQRDFDSFSEFLKNLFSKKKQAKTVKVPSDTPVLNDNEGSENNEDHH